MKKFNRVEEEYLNRNKEKDKKDISDFDKMKEKFKNNKTKDSSTNLGNFLSFLI